MGIFLYYANIDAGESLYITYYLILEQILVAYYLDK